MDDVAEVKSKADIVAVIGESVKLTRAGRNFKGLCPFHEEKSPSFMVSPELQIFKCFGCFPAGELVKTPFGFHKIENVVVGEYVVSGKGNYKKVITSHERDYEGSLVTLRLSKLTHQVKLTEDHIVYAVGSARMYRDRYKYLSKRLNSYLKLEKTESSNKVWKYFPIEKVKAGNLKKGMTLLYPINSDISDIKTLALSDYVSKKWPAHGAKPFVPPLKVNVDEDLLRLLGYYVAEGSNHRAYIRFSLGNHELDFAKEIVDITERIFGVRGSVYKRKGKRTGIEVTICNSILANLFENLCGKGADSKHLPFIFQQLPYNKQRILLDAVYKGDGYKRKFSKSEELYKAITTVSSVLEEQLRDILLRLGYFPTSNVQMGRKDKNGVNHKQAYTITWAIKPEISKFKHLYKDESGNEFWLLPVNQVSKTGFRGRVYNLTVEDDHSYVANTFAVANCGESGDVYTFLQKHEGMEFYEALKYLADKVGVKLKPRHGQDTSVKTQIIEANELAAKFYHYVLTKHRLGKPGLDYLTKTRGLSLTTINKFQLGFAPKNPTLLFNALTKRKINAGILETAGLVYKTRGGHMDRFRERVIFPITNLRGEVIALAGRILPEYDTGKVGKYINSPETPVYHKSDSLFGMSHTKDKIRTTRAAVVVEGELDFLSPWQSGVENIVAIKGTAMTESHVRILSRFADTLVMALDADFAGDAAAIRGLLIAANAGPFQSF